MPRPRAISSLVFSLLSIPLAAALAGPLTPPAGPVAPTPGPEPRIAVNSTNTPGDSDSTFRITSPGSYYLTAQVAAAPNKIGIEIDADGVTIDLNGFRIAGFPGSLDGIRTSGSQHANITIKNGSVGPVSGNGISLGYAGDPARACRVEGVTVIACGETGIAAYDDAIITNCIITDCGSFGIYAPFAAAISDCVVSRCSTGIFLADDGAVTDCLVSECKSDGILLAGAGRVENNTCAHNGTESTTGAGIHVFGSASHGAVLEGNHCSSNDRGIWVEGTGTTIISNTCSFNPWVIAAGNYYGPIIDRVNVATPGVFGTSAAGTLNTTDPNANFSY